MRGKYKPMEIGEKYGRLTVIGFSSKKTARGAKYYSCKCICGTIKDIIGESLRTSIKPTISCGCYARERVSETHRELPGEITFNEIELVYKRSAKKRNYSWNLDRLEFRNIITKNCHWCDKEPKLKNKYFNNDNSRIKTKLKTDSEYANQHWIKANGIDRKNNNIGYTLENCVSCCDICNYMKSTYSELEFLTHIEKISTFQKGKK